MFFIALRNLLQEKIRLLISIGGVAFSILLMLIMVGIYEGSILQFTRYIRENPTDLIISKEGVIDFFHGVSLISLSELEQFKQEEGIRDVVPMIGQRTNFESEGKQYHLFLVSFQTDKAQGAPWKISAGTKDIKDGEVVVSSTFAKKVNKKVDDELEFFEETFRIAGIVPDASTFGTHSIWMTYADSQRLAKLPDMVNFAFVTLNEPSSAPTKAKELSEKYTQWAVVDKQSFIANNQAELEESYLPIIQAIMIISFLIGTAIVGLMIYTSTIEKAREYGILKAIGIKNCQLYTIVAVQAIIIVILGLAVGIAGSFLLAAGLKEWIRLSPQIDARQVVWVITAGLGIGVISSFLPVRRLTRIDPAQVFKA